MATKRKTREWELHRWKVDDLMLKDPQVGPWAEAEARVDPLRKAILNGLNNHYPTKWEGPR